MRRLGQYELLEEIARGGMGVVYRARGLLGEVAIKRVSLPDADPRVLQEAQAALALRHPGIVATHHLDQDERGCPYLVMELVEGESLDRRLKRDGPLPIEEAVALTLQLCEALDHAHGQGVIHRDLKPANVMVDRSGRAKLADFGLGKLLDASRGLTESGTVLGTPGYMPPEQAAGEKEHVGPRSDVYGLGAVLHALLSGRAPFQRETLVNTLYAVLNDSPPRLSDIRPDVSPALERVVLRCLAKSPDDRPASAQALAGELLQARRGASATPGSATPAIADTAQSDTHATATASRNRQALALSTTITVLGLATAGWLLWSAGQGAPPRPATNATVVAASPTENALEREVQREPQEVVPAGTSGDQRIHQLFGGMARNREAAQARQQEADRLVNQAYERLQVGAKAEAMRLFDQADGLGDLRWFGHLNRARARHEHAQDTHNAALARAALDDLEQAAALERVEAIPDWKRAKRLTRLGQVLTTLVEHDEALAALDEAARLCEAVMEQAGPNAEGSPAGRDFVTFYNLGLALERRRDFAGAREAMHTTKRLARREKSEAYVRYAEDALKFLEGR